MLPCLESNVGVSEARIGEGERRIDRHCLSSVAELVSVVQELPLLDVESLDVGESAIGGEMGLLRTSRGEEE